MFLETWNDFKMIKKSERGGVVCGLFVALIELHTMPVWRVNPY
jgi:hypothetical protein